MKSLNQVRIRSHLTQNARIAQAADRMMMEVRAINAALYLVAWLPALLVFVVPEKFQFVCSAVSLFLNVVTQVTDTAMYNHKERAIMVLQLYEANITNTIYARIEYDRESTNETYEYSLRKSKIKDTPKFFNYYVVPDSVEEKYAYLYTQRRVVAENRYLLGKWRIYLAIMMFTIAAIATGLIIFVSFTFEYSLTSIIPQVVCFWPVLIPIVTKFNEAGASSKRCVKISADIDNFFADHDRSAVRLERFNYYIQSLMFEFRLKLGPIPYSFRYLFSHKLRIMQIGICERFLQAVYDLEGNTSLGKMKNAAFIEAEIKTVDAAGNEYLPIKSKDKDDEQKDIPDQINIMIRKNTEAQKRARAIEKLSQKNLEAKQKSNKQTDKSTKVSDKKSTAASATKETPKNSQPAKKTNTTTIAKQPVKVKNEKPAVSPSSTKDVKTVANKTDSKTASKSTVSKPVVKTAEKAKSKAK